MEVTTLEDFDFDKLPAKAQRAYFADADPLWPKNSKGERVKPRKRRKKSTSSAKSSSKSKRSTTKKAATKSKSSKRKTTKKRRSTTSSGMTTGQKWTVGLISVGILTWAIVKKP